MKISKLACLVLLCFSLFACSGGGGGSSSSAPEPIAAPPLTTIVTNTSDEKYSQSLPLADNSQRQTLSVLLMGNSHSIGLQTLLTTILRQSQANKIIEVQLAPGSGFLADRVNDGGSEQSLESKQWSHVVLQAQKYSASGQVDYPTTAAEYWIRGAKEQGATPIMFPEHPLRGNREEGQSLQNLHWGIAQVEPACVAPVGPAWDEAFVQAPNLAMHESDGNHASQTGMFLTSVVLYMVITGDLVENIPLLTSIDLPVETQTLLKSAASYSVFNYQPCFFET